MSVKMADHTSLVHHVLNSWKTQNYSRNSELKENLQWKFLKNLRNLLELQIRSWRRRKRSDRRRIKERTKRHHHARRLNVLAQHLIPIRPRVPTATHLVLPARIRNLTPLRTPQGQGQRNGIANARKDFEVAQALNFLNSRGRSPYLSVSILYSLPLLYGIVLMMVFPYVNTERSVRIY